MALHALLVLGSTKTSNDKAAANEPNGLVAPQHALSVAIVFRQCKTHDVV